MSDMTMWVARAESELPPGTGAEDVSSFLCANMKPYNDSDADTRVGVERALRGGGFVVCAVGATGLAGALVMLDTGMSGYVPPNLLLFVGVEPSLRGRGIGRALIERAIEASHGGIKLHVEQDNPARRLYERMGFRPSYIDMRLGR
jgi:GNAT superfamily N-acetyltransferase